MSTSPADRFEPGGSAATSDSAELPSRPGLPFESGELPAIGRPFASRRFVSITFDDGLIIGATKAASLMSEAGLHGTFYVVTGWVRPRLVPWIRDPFNRGRDHGTWTQWRAISAAGHEIGSHTVSHLNLHGRLFRAFPPILRWEVSSSARTLSRQIGVPPISISMPWNSSALALQTTVEPFYRACRLGDPRPSYNDLSAIEWYALRSWAPDSDTTLERFADVLHATPPGHWLILQFHSLDGEGYMPISSEKFRRLLSSIASQRDMECTTVAAMAQLFQTTSGGASRA